MERKTFAYHQIAQRSERYARVGKCLRYLSGVSSVYTLFAIDSRCMHTDDSNFTLGTSRFSRKLSDDSHGMTELSLAASELAIHLADAARLEAAIENTVPLLAACRNAEARFSGVSQLRRCHETEAVRLR